MTSVDYGVPECFSGGRIEVWTVCPTDLSPASLGFCETLLSTEERSHVARFRHERNRAEAIVSCALVRIVVSRYTGLAATSLHFRRNPHGKPELHPARGIYFNSSHRSNLVACAVGVDRELGIDLEPISCGGQVLRLADSVFTESEMRSFSGLSDAERVDRAVTLWTLKEAFVKARGLGLSGGLRDFSVIANSVNPSLLQIELCDGKEGNWLMASFDVRDFRLALVVRSSAERIVFTQRDATVEISGAPSASSDRILEPCRASSAVEGPDFKNSLD